MAGSISGLFVDVFEIGTRGNYNIASEFGKYHVDTLFLDSTTSPVALICYNNVKPKWDIFEANHNIYLSQTGTQGGEVLSFKSMLRNMPINVDDWQSKIKGVYAINTPRFKALFPNGKNSLNRGKQKNRVNAVLALITTIGTDASLATIKATIQAFYTTLLAAFNHKDSAKLMTHIDSSDLESSRINMCIEIEGNFGLLKTENKATPSLSAKYFNVALFNNSQQTSFDKEVKARSTKNVLQRTFVNPITQQVRIINSTDTTVHVFLSARRAGLVGLVFVIIPPLSDEKYDLKDMGDNTTEKFLNIYNTDTKIKAILTIKVV